jgi:hypothetical protein
MAFCSNCGNPLTGNEKFCAQCGATVSSAAPSAAAPASSTAPSAPPRPAPPVAAAAYPAASPAPVVVTVPSPAQPTAQKKGLMGTVIAVILVAGIGYYYYQKTHPPTPANNPPASQPGSPSTQPSSGSGGGNAALVNLQSFNAHWQDESGMLVLTTASWANNSNTNITSATLQCRQYDNAGNDLSMYRVTLNGPTNAGTTSTFSNVSLGATANGMTKVDCEIIHVKP